MRRLPYAFAVVLLLMSWAFGAKEKDKDKDKTKWGAFSAYASARKLCHEHVLGTTMEIEWQTFATADAPDKVVAFYEKDLGRKADAGANGDFTLHATTKVDDLITVYSVDKSEAHPSCAEKPRTGERTVILVAQATPGGPAAK